MSWSWGVWWKCGRIEADGFAVGGFGERAVGGGDEVVEIERLDFLARLVQLVGHPFALPGALVVGRGVLVVARGEFLHDGEAGIAEEGVFFISRLGADRGEGEV